MVILEARPLLRGLCYINITADYACNDLRLCLNANNAHVSKRSLTVLALMGGGDLLSNTVSSNGGNCPLRALGVCTSTYHSNNTYTNHEGVVPFTEVLKK